MPATTCYGYSKRYKTNELFKKNIIRHAKKNGIIIDETNELARSIEDFMKIIPKAMSQKRPCLSLEKTSDNFPVNTKPMSPKRLCTSLVEFAQLPVQKADAATVPIVQFEQPMADAAPVPIVQPEQPMEQEQAPMQETMGDAAPVPIVPMEQEQAPMQEKDAALIAFPAAAKNETEIIQFVLKLSNGADFIVPVRRDGYVNVTKICQAAGKRLQHYKDRAENKHFLDRFVALTRIRANAIFEVIQGGNLANVEQGTFAHPDIAIHIAQWCSADFSIQVSRWVRQLMTTGRVELGNEMSTKQLDDVLKCRIEQIKAKAAADLDAERNRCQEIILQKNKLELQLATIEDAQQLTKAAQEELVAIKVREDLETAIQFQVNTTAPKIATFKEGDNVLYLARIDKTKFKYGHTKNLKRRFDAHKRPGVYPTFDIIKIFQCANGVSSEDKIREYAKKEKIGCSYTTQYGTQREIITLESVDALQRIIKKMYKFCLQHHVSTQLADVIIRRIDAKVKTSKIDADVKIQTKRMEVETKQMEISSGVETKRIELLMECKITFEQYMQMNKI
jgi:KilA-N domain